MSRTRKIASGWRTVGRINRMNRRLCARMSLPPAPPADASTVAQVRRLTYGVKGSPPLNTHLISRAARNVSRAFDSSFKLRE